MKQNGREYRHGRSKRGNAWHNHQWSWTTQLKAIHTDSSSTTQEECAKTGYSTVLISALFILIGVAFYRNVSIPKLCLMGSTKSYMAEAWLSFGFIVASIDLKALHKLWLAVFPQCTRLCPASLWRMFWRRPFRLQSIVWSSLLFLCVKATSSLTFAIIAMAKATLQSFGAIGFLGDIVSKSSFSGTVMPLCRSGGYTAA